VQAESSKSLSLRTCFHHPMMRFSKCDQHLEVLSFLIIIFNCRRNFMLERACHTNTKSTKHKKCQQFNIFINWSLAARKKKTKTKEFTPKKRERQKIGKKVLLLGRMVIFRIPIPSWIHQVDGKFRFANTEGVSDGSSTST